MARALKGTTSLIRSRIMYFPDRIVLFFVFLLVSSNQKAFSRDQASLLGPHCTERDIFRQYKRYFPEDKEMVTLPDGGGMINPFFINQTSNGEMIVERQTTRRARLLKDVSAISEADALKIIDKVILIFIQEIAGSTPENRLNSSQKLMIKRIQLLNFEFVARNNAEASHSTSHLSISIVNSALKSPRLAFVALIAHEIGHALDLCHLSANLLQRHNPIDPSILLDDKSLKELVSSASGFGLDAQARKDPIVSQLIDSLIQNKSLQVVEQGIPLESNPALAVYNCLSQNSEPRSRYPILDKNLVCQGSDFTETGAQIWAARITAKYLQLNEPASRLDALGLFAYSLPSFVKDTPDIKELDMDKIYLAQESMQEIFGCRSQNVSCMSLFKPSETP